MDLEAKLDEWVARGLITRDQADAIRAAERAPATEGAPHRIPLAAQALGYLGGSLALVAAAVSVARFWTSLEVWAKLALVALATAVFALVGLVVRRVQEPAIRRLGGFLWFLSAAGSAFFVALLGVEQFHARPERVMFITALSTSAYALVLWLVHRAALQQLALFAAVVASAIGAFLQYERPPFEFFGLLVWGAGVAWAFLAWGDLVRPSWTGYVLACLAVLLGAQIFSSEMRAWGLVLGLASAVALTAASVWLREAVFLGFGAAGIFVFVPQAIFEYLGETIGASLALFVAGIVLIAVALLVARLRPLVVREVPQT